MVREWSYLTTNNESLVSSKLIASRNAYTFKVFHLTTRFKRYKRYKTIFLRQHDALRKRKTNWLNLLGIISQWSTAYIKCKYSIRVYQSMSVFKYSLVLNSLNFFQKTAYEYMSILNFNTFFLKKQYERIQNYKNYYTPHLVIQTSKLSNLLTFNPYIHIYESISYCPDIYEQYGKSKQTLFQSFNLWKLLKLKLVCFYKIVIKIILQITHKLCYYICKKRTDIILGIYINKSTLGVKQYKIFFIKHLPH